MQQTVPNNQCANIKHLPLAISGMLNNDSPYVFLFIKFVLLLALHFKLFKLAKKAIG